MMATYQIAPRPAAAVEAARWALEEYERSRADLRRRRQFWDGATWEAMLAQVGEAEEARDADLRAEGADLSRATYEREAAERAIYNAIDGDAAWYGQLATGILRTIDQWVERDVNAVLVDEARRHWYAVEQRRLARTLDLRCYMVARVERRRRDGSLPDNQLWQVEWDDMMAALSQLEAHYGRAETALPEAMANEVAYDRAMSRERLRSWCEALLAYQRETIGGLTGPERVAARVAERALDALIVRLTPRRRHAPAARRAPAQASGGGAVAIVGLLFVGLVVALVAGGAQTDEARPAADTARARELTGAALIRIAAGDCGAAAPLLEAAMQADPAFYQPYNDLAFCRYAEGRDAEAVELWRQAVALSASSADARAGLATALYVAGEAQAGRSLYREALALDGRYADEGWMRSARYWGERALTDSRPLRAADR